MMIEWATLVTTQKINEIIIPGTQNKNWIGYCFIKLLGIFENDFKYV